MPRHLLSFIAVALTALGCAGEASFRGPAAAAAADGASVHSDAGVAKTLGNYRGCGDRRYLARNGCGDDQSARAYYGQVGADALTLSAWQQRAFGGSLEACLVAEGQPVGPTCAKLVSGIYRNAAEIGLWGELVCTATVGRQSGGCLVRYWAAEGDRDRGVAPLATLAMDVDTSGSARFYSFAQDGTVTPSAALDSEGPKHLPDSCTNCHGGSFDGATPALGSVFRELSPEYLVASSQQTLEQAQSDWYAVNRAIQSANQTLVGAAAARAATLFDELYATPPAHRSAAQLLPTSWQAGVAPLSQAKRELWSRVVAPYCAGCHRAGKLDFTDYRVFAALASQVGGKSLLRRSLAGDGLAVMPQSQRLADSLSANAQAQSAIDAWLAAAQPLGSDTQAPLSLARLQSTPSGAAVEVAVFASDNVGVARVQLLLDGKLVFERRYDAPDLTRTEVFEIKPSAPGAKALEIVAIDAADNRSSARVKLSVGAGASTGDGGGGAGQVDGGGALDGGSSASGSSDSGESPVAATPRAQGGEQPEYGYTCSAAPSVGGRAPWISWAALLTLLYLGRACRRRRQQRHRRRRGATVATICTLTIIGGASVARAKTNGVAGHSGKVAALTCALAACHSDAVAVQKIAINGANTAEIGELVRLTLDVTDAASSATGVGIAASGGSLAPDAASGLVALGVELVHAQPGTASSWAFDFKADQGGTYTVYAAAILGDGDQSAGGDRFGMASFVINVGAGATPPQQPAQPNPADPPADPTGSTPSSSSDDEIVYGGCQMTPRASWPTPGCLVLLLAGLLAVARRRRRRSSSSYRVASRVSLALLAVLVLSSSAAAARKRVVVLFVSGAHSGRLQAMVKRHLGARYLVIKPRTLRRLCRERGERTIACRRHFRVVADVRVRVAGAQLTVSVLDTARRATAWGRIEWQAGSFYSHATRALRLVRRGLARARRLFRPRARARRLARRPRLRRRARRPRLRRRVRRPRARRAAASARRRRTARDRFVFDRPVLVRRSVASSPRRVRTPHHVAKASGRVAQAYRQPAKRFRPVADAPRAETPAPLSFPATKYAGRRSTSAQPTAERKLERRSDDGAAPAAPEPIKVASVTVPSSGAAAKSAAPSERPPAPSINARASDRVRDGLFAISLALGFSSRRLTLTRPDAAPNGRYEGAPYPEITAGVSAFPLGLLTKSAWRNLGVALRYSQDVSASSKDGSASKQLKTASRELLVDLQLRWTFHAGKLPVHFRGSVGWGMRDFSIDENDALTSLRYRFARVAGALRVPLGTPLVCLGFAADVRAIYSVGEEALRSLGTRTGGAIAYALSPGLSGSTKMGLFYFANFELLQFGATFVGLEAGTARQNSADTEATTHSTDRFMRFWIGGGYAF